MDTFEVGGKKVPFRNYEQKARYEASPLNKALRKKMEIKDKVVDKVSDALSLPARMYHRGRETRGNNEANVLKSARQYKGAGSFDLKGNPTDALKVRTMADAIRMRHGHKAIY